MYSLNYNNLGKVSSIQNDSMCIPLNSDNGDFQAFLEWNIQQAIPLDLNSYSAAAAALGAAERARLQAKINDIVTNLPDWSTTSTAIDNANTVAKLQVIVKKIARVLYWLAKDTAN